MGAHHLATVALVVLSYMLNVHLLGEAFFWSMAGLGASAEAAAAACSQAQW